MSNEKETYSREFKAKVVLEATSGEEINPQEVAEKHNVTPQQILSWAQEMDISDVNLDKLAEKVEASSGSDEVVDLEAESDEFIAEVEYGASYDLQSIKRLVIWTVFGAGFVLLTIIALIYMYNYSSTTHQQVISEQSEFYEIRELKQRDQETLSSFGVIDLEEGIYHIPIDSVITRMTENPE